MPADRPYLQSMIRVRDCSFTDNRAVGPAGWGIGLAHIRDVLIEGCSFEGHRTEAVHVEDYSEAVRLVGNHFLGCAKGGGVGAITLITAARRVAIMGNVFDMAGCPATSSAVCVIAGREPGRDHQLPKPWPRDVAIIGNVNEQGGAADIAIDGRCERVVIWGNVGGGP